MGRQLPSAGAVQLLRALEVPLGCLVRGAKQVGSMGVRFPPSATVLPRGVQAGVPPGFLGWVRAECGQQWRQLKDAGRVWVGCK